VVLALSAQRDICKMLARHIIFIRGGESEFMTCCLKSCSAAILAAVVAASCRHSQTQLDSTKTEGKMPSGQPAGSWRYIEAAFSDNLFSCSMFRKPPLPILWHFHDPISYRTTLIEYRVSTGTPLLKQRTLAIKSVGAKPQLATLQVAASEP
jgi:hypothetical protein